MSADYLVTSEKKKHIILRTVSHMMMQTKSLRIKRLPIIYTNQRNKTNLAESLVLTS